MLEVPREGSEGCEKHDRQVFYSSTECTHNHKLRISGNMYVKSTAVEYSEEMKNILLDIEGKGDLV